MNPLHVEGFLAGRERRSRSPPGLGFWVILEVDAARAAGVGVVAEFLVVVAERRGVVTAG